MMEVQTGLLGLYNSTLKSPIRRNNTISDSPTLKPNLTKDTAVFSKRISFGNSQPMDNNTMNLKELFPQEMPECMELPETNVGKEIFINGELKKWEGETEAVNSLIQTYNEGDKEPKKVQIGELAQMEPKDALNALNYAAYAYNKGQGEWPKMSIEDRIKVMEQIPEKMKEDDKLKKLVVKLLMHEIGKSKVDATKEYDRTIISFENTLKAVKDFVAQQKEKEKEQNIIGDTEVISESRKPIGVVLCMGPTNYPVNEGLTDVFAALLAGNTVVCKPAQEGALSVAALAETMGKYLPPGAFNLILGKGSKIIPDVMSDGRVAGLAYVGSKSAAERIIGAHPNHKIALKTALGMDAKNAGIIMPDANMENAVESCVKGALSYNGQRCTALKIIFVHKSRAEDFKEKFNKAVSELKIDMPYESGAYITPISTETLDKQQEIIQDAKDKDGKVEVFGGEHFGNIMRPAILYGVKEGMRAYTEEQFGPVVPVVTFEDPQEVVDYLKKLKVGQQASVFAREEDIDPSFIQDLGGLVTRVNINTQCQRSPDILKFDGRGDTANTPRSDEETWKIFTKSFIVTKKANNQTTVQNSSPDKQ